MREEDKHTLVISETAVDMIFDRIAALEKRVRDLEEKPAFDPEMVKNSALDMIREIEGSCSHIGGFDEFKKTKT